MIELQKREKKSPEGGFSLLEVMASAVILLLAAGVVSQLLPHPKQKVAELERRSAIVDYLDAKLTSISERTPYPTGTEILCNSGCSQTCDSTVCNGFATDCPNPTLQPDLDLLNQIVFAHPTMCYVQVKINHDCDPTNTSPNAKQICANAKWWKGGTAQNEALTTFLFRP
jgi:type II secretory pathway pseudopilin PulG